LAAGAQVHQHHGHDHSHDHDHNVHRRLPSVLATRRLMLVLGLTATFLVVEVLGGIISGSLALLADAGHMATDVAICRWSTA
jgi:cobalt-zinc-cadmium efflux system protein